MKSLNKMKITVLIMVVLLVIICSGYFIHKHNVEEQKRQEMVDLVNLHYDKVNNMMKMDTSKEGVKK